VPPVVGYTAVSNQLDLGAWIIFFILVFWQMPHFYAIAMFREQDYAAANLPVLPAKLGLKNAKVQIIVYILAFTTTCLLLTQLGLASYTYGVIMLLLCLRWVFIALQGWQLPDVTVWSRKLFKFSLIVLTTFCILLMLDPLFPW
jgi:protoheme IX farnesyltransferase